MADAARRFLLQQITHDSAAGIQIGVDVLLPQIVEQIKAEIMQGKLKCEESLPSVRSLSKDLRISALTVKKAYDTLETEGFIVTVHGKGSFVAGVNQNLVFEEQKKEVEKDMETVIRKGRCCGMTDEEIAELFHIVLEE